MKPPNPVEVAEAPPPGGLGRATPAEADACDFLEGKEDPAQSKELERQQDA